MKKFSKSFLICAVLCLSVMFFTSCSCSQQTKVQDIAFESPFIDLYIGDVYNAKAVVVPSNASNNRVVYRLENPIASDGRLVTVLRKTGDSEFVAREEGEAIIYATSVELGVKKTVSQKVRVLASQLTLDTPVGLRYENGKVVWDKVTYSIGESNYDAFGYVVNLNGLDMSVTAENYFQNLPAGRENKLKVRAVSNSETILQSDFSSEISVYVLPTPTNLQRQGTTISWDEVANAGAYDVYVNGERYIENVTDLSCEIDFASTGTYAVSVVAVPKANSEFVYQSAQSETISIVKLDKVSQISISNGIVTWNEVLNALEYKVLVENADNAYTFNAGIYNRFDLSAQIPTIVSGDYDLRVVAVSNETMGINGNKSEPVQITKLQTPTNLRVENNALVWDAVANASNYTITVNGGDEQAVSNNFTLPENSDAGAYLFKIKAYGDGTRYFDSDLTTDANAFETYKLQSPESISNSNNIISFNTIENASSYKFYDYADAENVTAFASSDVEAVTSTGSNKSVRLTLQDKVTLDDIQLEGDRITTLDKYYALQNRLNENYFKIKVQAIAVSGENYFDSNVSERYVDFHRLFAPPQFSIVYAYSTYVYTNAVYLEEIRLNSEESYNLYTQANLMGGNYGVSSFKTVIKYQQYENGKLVDRFAHKCETLDDGITKEEMDKVKGGDIYVSICYSGNGTTVIDSEYRYLRLASSWEVYNSGRSFNILAESADVVAVPRMFEPTAIYMDGVNLKYSVNGASNERYTLSLKNAKGEYSKVYSGNETSIDLSSIITTAGTFDLRIVTEPTDNTDYTENNRIQNLENGGVAGTTLETDKFSFNSKAVAMSVTRLPAPSIALNGGYLEWADVAGAGGYDVYLNGVKLANASVHDNEDGSHYWYPSQSISGEDVVQVVAKAQHSHDAELDALVMDSPLSTGVSYNRLVLSGFAINGDILTVQTEETNVDVILQVYNTQTQVYKIYKSSNLSINLSKTIKNAGPYQIAFHITRKADALQDKLDSVVCQRDSNQNPILLYVLDNPTVTFSQQTSTISWLAVNGAEGYKIAYKVSGTDDVVYSDATILSQRDLSTFADLESGVSYDVTVVAVGPEVPAVGANYYTISSYADFENNSYAVTRMGEVETLAGRVVADNYVLEWSAVDGATYNVYLNGTLLTNVETNSYTIPLSQLSEVRQYKFKVRAVSSDGSKIPSLYSEEWVVTRLQAPTAQIKNGAIYVENYAEDCGNVKIAVQSAENANVYTGNFASEEISIDDITQLEAGKVYSLVVSFAGNGTSTLSSGSTTISGISRVDSVQGLTLSSSAKRLEWQAVAGITKYKVVYTNVDTNAKVAEYVQTTYATISSGVLAGNISAVVYAVGNDADKVNSVKSNAVTFKKLDLVTNVAVNNGKLTFTKLAETSNYIVKVVKDGIVNEHSYTYSESGFAIDLTEVGLYEVSVQAVGGFVATVNSNFTEAVSVVNLSSVENINVLNGVISWDEVENAQRYKVILSGAGSYEVEVNTNEYEIEVGKLASGVYNLTILAIGNGSTILTSAGAVVNNAFTILAQVTNVGFNEYKQLKWDAVSGASSYNLLIEGQGEYKHEQSVIANVVDLPTDLVAGNYKITVTAVGDSHKVVNAKVSADFNVTKLATPKKIKQQSEVLSVSQLAGVSAYVFEITLENGAKVLLDSVAGTTSANYAFSASGVYTIKAYSKGDYLSTIDSDISEPITVRRLEEVLVQINGDILSWTENEYVESNDFGYKVILSDNEAGTDATEVSVYQNELNLSTYAFSSGALYIWVMCQAGDETAFLPSKTESVVRGYVDAPIIAENFTNNNIVWSLPSGAESVKTAIAGYEVKVIDAQNRASTITVDGAEQMQVTLGDDYSAGKYKVSVRIIGNGSTLLNSAFSTEKEVYKLPTAQVLIKMQSETNATSNYIATWDVVQNATSYVVILNNSQTITTSNNYIVLDTLDGVTVGENSIRLKVNGDASYYLSSKTSEASTFTMLDCSTLNLRVESGKVVWDSVENIKLYQLKINETLIDCGTSTSYELGTAFNSGIYKFSMRLIANSNRGYSAVVINSQFTAIVEGYKLQTPNAPTISNGMLKVSAVEYKNLEAELANMLTYEIVYGNYNQTVILDKTDDLINAIYSDKVGEQCEIKYRAVGDDYNLNSDWTSSANRVDGIQLANVSGVAMRDGVLSWSAVPNATKYKLVASVLDETGEETTQVYEQYVDSTSILNPFYLDEFKDVGVTLAISVVSVGTINSLSATVGYTNSSGTEGYEVVYLPKAINIITADGILTWTGTSVNGYDVEIDGNAKFTANGYYEFEDETAGKHTIRIRLKGNGEEIVNGIWSDYAVVYKIATPEFIAQSYLSDGKLAWQTDAGFLSAYADADIEELGLFEFVQIAIANNDGLDAKLTKTDIITTLASGKYTSNLQDYFDNLDAGTYSFRIKNLGTTGATDANRFVNSVYSNAFVVTILEAPQNVQISSGILTWANVSNNNGYLIEIGKQDGSVSELRVARTQNQDACFVDLNDYAVGKYSFKIRAIGDSSRYLTSRQSEEVKVEVLPCPTNIAMNEGTLVWNTILGASNYTIKAVNVVNSAEFEFENISAKTTSGKDYFELPEGLVAGTYDVYIKSIGDGVEYITSKYMVTPKRITKLQNLEGFANELGKLVWGESTLSDGTKALGYKISVTSVNADVEGNTEFEIKAYRVPKNGESAQVTVRDGVCYYELPASIPMGDLTIKVKALGDDDATASSSYTQEMSATKLDVIQRVYLEDGVIKWAYESLGWGGFYLVVGGGAVSEVYEGNLISEYKTEFPTDLPAGTYDVYLKVVGNTVASGATDRRYLSSNLGEPLEIVKLAQVNGFTAYNGMLVWNEVSGAKDYELKFYKDGQNEIKAISARYDSELRKYVYEPIGLTTDSTLRFGEGNYKKITIRAMGGSNYINSQEVEITDIFKISRPTSIEVVTSETNAQELKLKWQIVSFTKGENKIFVKKYRLRLVSEGGQEFVRYVSYDDGEISASTPTLTASTFFECDINSLFDIGSGTYLLSIQSCSLPTISASGYDVWDTINSDYSVNVSVTKPAPPANLKFDDALKAFVWDKPQLDAGLEVSYNVTYIYKTSETVDKFEVVSEITSDTFFYPRKLGVYYVAVKAIVSGNLTSDFIGKNNVSLLSVKGLLGDGLTDAKYVEKFLSEYGAKGSHDLFDSGEGTIDKPYIIKTAKQLSNLGYYYLQDMYFELANSINFAGSSVSIGSKSKPFAGTLNGNNFSISNVILNGTLEAIGIFGYAQDATIRNLTLSNVTVTTSRQETTYAGLLVGYADNVTIENVLVGGSITQGGAGNSSVTFYLGGVVGYGKGQTASINKAKSFANINFSASDTSLIVYSGGIAGYFEADIGESNGIIACGNEGSVQGTIAGGIVASGNCAISNCYNVGSVTAFTAKSSDAYAGGIVGKMESGEFDLLNVYNIGAVTANASAMKNCYAGGLVGRGACSIINAFNSGVISTSKVNSSKQSAGWLVGQNINNSIYAENCYNTSSTTQNSGSGVVSDGCTTITATELNNAVQTYLGSAFTYSTTKQRVVLVIEASLLG